MKRKELNRIIHSAINELDDDDKELINELYFNHASIHKLASRYGITRSAVRYRRNKALARLKEVFEEEMK